ncbi:MAG: DJ-1/PfpI family protein [Clostridiales Family XIII bacterium]|jgi:4-methyl-5(b-hydroxyethyl)-thiazole monophosphate biosynthesis|nr:DJ-1/PfpI family protein [Clostridiales Family XIII bacterium]
MVLIHIAEGFEEIEALTVVDILRRADVEAKTVSIMGRRHVAGAHGIEITTDYLQADAPYDQAQMLFLPGGMPGASFLDKDTLLGEKLVEFAEAGKWVVAICAAPMVLGHLGIVKGKNATIYPSMEGELKGANVITDEDVVVDGNIITSRGPATSMAFALKLVEVLKGKALADEIAGNLLYV